MTDDTRRDDDELLELDLERHASLDDEPDLSDMLEPIDEPRPDADDDDDPLAGLPDDLLDRGGDQRPKPFRPPIDRMEEILGDPLPDVTDAPDDAPARPTGREAASLQASSPLDAVAESDAPAVREPADDVEDDLEEEPAPPRAPAFVAPPPSVEEPFDEDREAQAIRGLAAGYKRMREEIAKVIVGQEDVVDQILIGMFSRGHCLLVGVPGLAKTLLVSTIASILQLAFRRIQFTPDLMPSDITGTDVLQDDPETGRRTFRFMQGPIFTNVLLADEINRTPPKTQAALLEAMQERHVTVGNNTYRLPSPFFVLATQNPIEQEGTYPLPEAQLDRFMFNVVVKYPTAAEELRILKQTTGGHVPELRTALTGPQILALQEVVRKVPAAEDVFVYARDIVRATRPNEEGSPKFVREYLGWGAGPRAGQYLILGAKARAILQGRFHVSTADVKAVAHPVLRHRIVTTFHADSEGVTTDDVIDMVLETVPVPYKQRAKRAKRG
jgi:MoxR-like ATPase